ncbi:MAG TPA: PH domain-containing protein [Candidatus Eisenbacteria bacterium]|nr:PH domain-containing protein [Candidatus Eisenbacteria bacterium]
MGYVDANLVPGESIAYRARLHWIVVAPSLLGGAMLDLLGVALVVVALVRNGPGGEAALPMIVGGALLMVAGSAFMAAGMIRWKATEITVTNRRVFIKTGVVSRHTKEILLAKVESVAVEETMLARILGFGRVTVHGTGGTPETFERIARPHEFRRQVQIQIEALARPGVGAAARG